MSESESENNDDNLRSVIEDKMRERLPTLQSAIQTKTGKKIDHAELERMLSGEITGVVAEVTVLASSAYSGPLPSPAIMRGYAELFDLAPAQLFNQFKAEQDHRHKCEQLGLNAAIADQRRRDYGAIAMAFFGICLAVYLAFLGAHIPAAVLTGALVLGGGALVLGKQFLASHNESGTQVSINSGEAAKQSDAKNDRNSQRVKKSR